MSKTMFSSPRVPLLSRVAALVFSLLIVSSAFSASNQKLFVPMVQSPRTQVSSTLLPVPVVFVSRQIPDRGSIYWDPVSDMPGVGPHSRFRVASPGKLLVLEPNGTTRTLIDGSKPTVASLNLIDVNAPDVSYDGKTIVFAGLPAGNYDRGPVGNPGVWRLYAINADGSSLHQLTTNEPQRSMAQFGEATNGLTDYDDTDPAWLPDGRIVFSSTRWPSYAQYSGVRTSNLYVVNADGAALHRITAERNGADRPMVDPLTGKIVYARWWRNHRFPIDSMATITDPKGGYIQKDGLTADRTVPVGGETMFRNAWQATAINPDGTNVAMWSGHFRVESDSHVYGGAFAPDGTLYANFFPMYNMTEAGGFGGIRRYTRGPGLFTSVVGVTNLSKNYAHPTNPTSFGIYSSSYAADPAVLPDGRLVFSWAKDTAQDYGIYTTDAGGARVKLYDNPGTTELRARLVAPRTVPPLVKDTITAVASTLPPDADGPFDQDGTFTFDALNVYANGPVDSDIVSAPPVGSARTIRFFVDHQRTSPGSFPNRDWPILLHELPVNANGSVKDTTAPANLPLFEQLRSADYRVPLTIGPTDEDGAAHVAGMNFGRPGTQVRCVGCHTGHSMLQVPANDADALWTNLAPGAQVSVSSTRDAQSNRGVNDRRVLKGEIWRYWVSAANQTSGQWAKLTFPVPITARTVRLYNSRQGDEANSSLQVKRATVRLLDANGAEIASKQVGQLAAGGTDVSFGDISGVVAVKVDIDEISGTFYGMKVAGIAEIEVIAKAG